MQAFLLWMLLKGCDNYTCMEIVSDNTLLWKHLEWTLIRHILEFSDFSRSLTTIYNAGFPHHSECTKTETRQNDSYPFPIGFDTKASNGWLLLKWLLFFYKNPFYKLFILRLTKGAFFPNNSCRTKRLSSASFNHNWSVSSRHCCVYLFQFQIPSSTEALFVGRQQF